MDIREISDTAIEYVKSIGYYTARISKITKIGKEEKTFWKVTVDVGSFTPQIKTVTIDESNGNIVGFE